MPPRVEHLEDRIVPAGEPILVLTTAANPFSSYYTEILRAEGLNAFATSDVASLSPSTLAGHDVVILGETPLTTSQVTTLSDWVTAGGNLIAMRPDKQLAGLLGITDAASTRANAYLLVSTASGPGTGIVNETIQYHGTADVYTLNGASGIATLYSTATTATSNPAVTLRSVGVSGGQAAAFTYDLARSIVYTRQGNPAWAGQNRDGLSPIRSNDLFYGNASFDPQPDWIDRNKMAIPQADEQQRLLANLIQEMNLDKKPLPRFWYLPQGEKAAVVMTGDDHAHGGTTGRFDQYIAASPPGSSPADWSAIRGTSYITSDTQLGNSTVAAYVAQGFEIALHLDTEEQNWTPAQLNTFFANQMPQFQASYPGLPTPVSHRIHALTWSDYATLPKIEAQYGIRFDVNYYHYGPAGWIDNRPGMMTGSGMPMRFADTDGTLINVYQAATQMTDESGQNYPATVNSLLDAALDTRGYYGVFTANMHTDFAAHPGSDAIVAAAKARGVPVVSARQMLDWLDGRNSSSFGSFNWNTSQNTLAFTIAPGAGANGLQAMVPVPSAGGVLTGLTRNGTPVAYTIEVIKGDAYAFFPGTTGTYAAQYGSDSTPPTVTARAPAPGSTGTSTTAPTISATFSESVQPATVNFVVTSSSGSVAGSTAYNPATNTVTFTPAAPLNIAATYTVSISGAQDHNGNAIAVDSWSFTTTSTVIGATIWPSTACPPSPSVGRLQPARAGAEVPLRRRRLHHGDPVLQGCGQHGDARRAPVDVHRHPAGHRHLHQRDGLRLAAGRFRPAGADSGQHHLRRLLLRPQRPLLHRQCLLRLGGRRFGRAARPVQRRGGRERRVPGGLVGLPEQFLQFDQLLGRRRLQQHPGARRHRQDAGAGSHGGERQHRCHGHVPPAAGPGDGHHLDLPSAGGRRRQRRAGHGQLLRPDGHPPARPHPCR